jgi:hypothetical protein
MSSVKIINNKKPKVITKKGIVSRKGLNSQIKQYNPPMIDTKILYCRFYLIKISTKNNRIL